MDALIRVCVPARVRCAFHGVWVVVLVSTDCLRKTTLWLKCENSCPK